LEFQKAGLKPGGPGGGYFQHFTVSGGAQLGQDNSLRLRGPLGQEIDLKRGVDFEVLGLSGSGRVTAPLVFVGYGASAPKAGYDDFQGLDVAGKVVVLLRHTPRWNNQFLPFDGSRKDEHAALMRKQALAEGHKAAAVILVSDRAEPGDKLLPFGYIAASPDHSSVPAVHVRRGVLDPVFQFSLGTDLRGVEEAIDRDLKPRGAPLAGWTASIQAEVKRIHFPVMNVVGVVEGSGPLADQTVVVGAHYDHLGYGARGSLAKDPRNNEIHHGADDNGSGTTSLLELARRFGGPAPRQGRRTVFMTFSAEEMGLLGSRHYCNKEPLFPLVDTVAMVNLDMVGRLSQDPKTRKDRLIVEGLGTARSFDRLIDQLNGNSGIELIKKQGGTGPSDHDSFYRKNIPVFFFWTGMHRDYHRPSDTADKINVAGMVRIAALAEKVIRRLATDKERPEYLRVASSFPPSAGKIPRIGIMPNYEADKEGVLVASTVDGGPAARAGIKAGDQIVLLAGKPVTNLSTYMVLMGKQQPGQPVEIGALRNGKKLSFKVVPQ
jgi:hypothetical protein